MSSGKRAVISVAVLFCFWHAVKSFFRKLVEEYGKASIIKLNSDSQKVSGTGYYSNNLFIQK
nr:MAG TPA: Beta-carotene 15,15'-dioxygenase [Caudoviricetes sp.]